MRLNVPTYESEYVSIDSYLRGSFDFSDKSTILITEEANQPTRLLTEIHEVMHSHVCSSTSFGVFQKLLANFSRERDLPRSIRNKLLRFLNRSIKHSWMIHEGISTTAELIHAYNCSEELYHSHYRMLPKSYQSATDPFFRLIVELRLPVFVNLSFCEAMAHIGLNTPILDDFLSLTTLLDTDPGKYFEDPSTRPDSRLTEICQVAGASLVSKDCRRRILETLKEHLQPKSLSYADLVDKWKQITREENQRIRDEVLGTSEAVLGSYGFTFPFVFTNPSRLNNQLKQVLLSWYNFFFDNNLLARRDIEVRFLESPESRLDHELNIEYPHSLRSTVCINESYSHELWQDLMERSASLYCLYMQNPTATSFAIDYQHYMMLEPGDSYYRFHQYVLKPSRVEYRCPLSQLAQLDYPCALTVTSALANEVFESIRASECIMVIPEHFLSSLPTVASSRSGQDTFGGTSQLLFVQTSSGAISHWNNVFDLRMADERARYCHARADDPDVDFLFVYLPRRNQVFYSATSSLVINRLIETRNLRLTEIGRLSEQWPNSVDSVLIKMFIVADHYARFGF